MPLKPPGIFRRMPSFLTFPPLPLLRPLVLDFRLAPLWWNTLPPICESRAASVWAHFRLQRHEWWRGWTWVQCPVFFFFCHWVTTQEQKFSFHFCFELLKATKITAALILANFIMWNIRMPLKFDPQGIFFFFFTVSHKSTNWKCNTKPFE